MGKDSGIQWTHHTFNPWRGCTKVSAGCAHCYAETLSHRNPGTLGVWGPQGTRVVASESMWRAPMKWQAAAKSAGERHRVFCASLADVFEDWQGPMTTAQSRTLYREAGDWHTEGPPSSRLTMQDVRERLFALIDQTPDLDWLLLTKRPENIARMLGVSSETSVLPKSLTGPRAISVKVTRGWRDNIWLGTSVESQATADERIPHLVKIPAKVRFLSMEPLLGPVDLSVPETMRFCPVCCEVTSSDLLPGGTEDCPCGCPWISCRERELNSYIDWIIVGGESGSKARPMDLAWVRSLMGQSDGLGHRPAIFVKQLGAKAIDCAGKGEACNVDPAQCRSSGGMCRLSLADAHGGDPEEWPGDLRVREFPKVEVS